MDRLAALATTARSFFGLSIERRTAWFFSKAQVFSAVFGALLLLQPVSARAATGFLALDEAAIPVKSPSSVYLDAVTRDGRRLVAGGEHGVIIYSDDDAGAWRQASVPVDATITSITFTSATTGWAVGNYGVILKTNDGGVTWKLQLNGVQANQLTAVAAAQAVATQSTAIGAPRATRRAQIFIEQGPNKPFFSVLPLDSQHIIAFGADRLTMRSDDGGATWRDASLAIGDPVSHNLYQAAPTRSGIYLAGEAGTLFRSTDGGASFPAITSPSDSTLFGAIAAGNGILTYGVAGGLYKSDDQGATWRQIAVPTAANLMAAIPLQSGALALASESGAIFVSHDGGDTFQPTPIQLPMALFAIAQAADGSLVAAGSRGIIKIPSGAVD